MRLFLNLMVVWCLGMTLYYFVFQPEETHEIIFWSMLTLFNNQSLIKLYKDD